MAVAVISEFNPFHNGHKYLLNKTKIITGEPIVAVMSGSFTQRGEVALTDKFERTQTALENGADLVVELPTVYAVSNAQRFARCGVDIAKSFRCINYLSFGCECDNTEKLIKASSAIDNSNVKNIIKTEMKSGNYYPRAVEKAVREVFGNETANILKTPNNILAVEYIRNLHGTNIKPLPVMRKGVAHDSTKTSEELASASHIRTLLRNNLSADKYMPKAPIDITYPENIERTILYVLRTMSIENISELPDVGEGLENRIFNAVQNYNSLEEIINSVKTKRYTHARIRRIITCALLGITEKLQTTPVEYVRVLGFNDNGAELLKSCNKEIVTSVAKAMKLGGNISALLEKDVTATDISSIAYKKIKPKGTDYTTKIIKL